jgi:oligopeptide transport system substrate-binding protein
MLKKRWLAILFVGVLLLAACGPAATPEVVQVVDEEAQARIAELEAQLQAAQEAGNMSEEELSALQSQLEDLQGELQQTEKNLCTFNAYRMGWVMDWADAGNMVDTVFGPTSDFQYTFWQLTNPDAAARFEELTTAAYRNTDMESRATQWQDAERIIVDEVVMVIPLYHYDRTTLVSTDINYLYPPFGAPRFADWSSESGKTTLIYPIGTAVPTLDVSRSTDTTSSSMIYQMFDAPYRFTAEGTIAPLAAESFDVSEDGTVFTVHLRPDAVWSDGEPVLAQHYVDGVKRLLSPDMANDYAYVMFDIVDAAAYNAGEVDDLTSIVALDDFTFQFTLSEPRSYFDSILAFSTFHPVRLDVIEANPDTWTQPGVSVSNGAFVLTEHNPGENLVFEKNELYWDAENVAFDRIEVPVITEPATCLAAFEAGEIDVTSCSFPPEDTPRLVDTPEFTLLPRPGVYYLGVNTVATPTDNVNMRKALASAIDKRTLLDEVAQTPWRVVANGVIPPEIFGYQGEGGVGYPFDVDAAQGYLADYMAEAGVEDAGSIVVELWYNKGGGNQDLLEAVEAMWEENLGIDVRTVNVEWASYLDTLEECNAIGGGGF